MPTLSQELVCDCCHQEPAVGVAASIGMPVSMAYGKKCLEAGVECYDLLVANTACCDGYENTADWWKELVERTLDYFALPMETFLADVQKSLDAEQAYFAGEKPPTPIE